MSGDAGNLENSEGLSLVKLSGKDYEKEADEINLK